MNKSIKSIASLVLVIFFLGCSPRVNVKYSHTTTVKSAQPKQAQNVILMIGDGMGLTQITAGKRAIGTLNIEQFPVVGIQNPAPADGGITDSAAGATAFSAGLKTYNGAVGVDVNEVPRETILEELAKKNYATGLVATCNITHATPASFYAHQPHRSMYYDIAADMVNAPVNVFVGGGSIHFIDRTKTDIKNGDKRNLMAEMEKKGFSFVSSLSAINTTNGNVGYFYSEDHPVSILNGRDNFLPDSIPVVIEKLKNSSDQGFFLMVEGSQIDWGGHANDEEYITTEMIDFDKAIGKALEFAKNDGNTLIIVTADHETGGFALTSSGDDYGKTKGTFGSKGHSATLIPVFAYGPGSKQFAGVYENTEIYHKMKQALGLRP